MPVLLETKEVFAVGFFWISQGLAAKTIQNLGNLLQSPTSLESALRFNLNGRERCRERESLEEKPRKGRSRRNGLWSTLKALGKSLGPIARIFLILVP